MAADKIKFMRELIKDRLSKVREQITEEAYLLYCSMVDDCSDYEELKHMADIELQVGYIEYINVNIVKRLKDMGYDLANVSEVLKGFCGIDSPIDLSTREVERDDVFDVRELIMGDDEELQTEIMAGVIREMAARMQNTPDGFITEEGVRPGEKCLIEYYDEVEAEQSEKDLDSLLNNMMQDEHEKYVEDGLVQDVEEELGVELEDAFNEIDDIESTFNNIEIDEDGLDIEFQEDSDINNFGLDDMYLDIPDDEQYDFNMGAEVENLGEQFGDFENSEGFDLDDLMSGNIQIDGLDSLENTEPDFGVLLSGDELDIEDDEFNIEEDESGDDLNFDSLLEDGEDNEVDFDALFVGEDNTSEPDFDNLLGDDFMDTEDGDDVNLDSLLADDFDDSIGGDEPDFDSLLGDVAYEDTDFDSLLGDEADGDTDFDSLLDGDDNDEPDFDSLLGDEADGDIDFESLIEDEDGGEVDFDSLIEDDSIDDNNVNFDSLLDSEPEDQFDALFNSVTSNSNNSNSRSLSEAINNNIPLKAENNNKGNNVVNKNGGVFTNNETQKTFNTIANVGKRIEGLFKGKGKK